MSLQQSMTCITACVYSPNLYRSTILSRPSPVRCALTRTLCHSRETFVTSATASASDSQPPGIAPSSAATSLVLPPEQLFPLSSSNTSGVWEVQTVSYGASRTKLSMVNNRPAVKAFYPKGSKNPGSRPQGGVGFISKPRSIFPADHVILQYSLKFQDNFQWVRGGKLPGLVIGKPGATGGRRSRDKGSYRVMWGTHGISTAYVYPPLGATQAPDYQQQEGWGTAYPYGDGLWKGVLAPLRKGVWNRVAVEIRLNAVVNGNQPLQDGYIRLRVNDEEREYDKMVWRQLDDIHIHSILFETFYGGHDHTWATPNDTSTYFRDIVVTRVDG